MRVAYFLPRAREGRGHSVQHIADGIIATLDPEFEASRVVSRYESSGVLARLYNIIEAKFRQEQVNHITGDVHFLTYLLDPRRTVLTVLDCGRINGEPNWRKWVVKLFWFSIPVRQCAAITVISGAVKDDLLRHVHIDPEMVHVVPVAVPSVYKRVPRRFNSERPVVLQVGTNPNKNLPRTFEALADVPCELRVIGPLTPEQRALLDQFGLSYENFINLTNEQMLEQYSQCDVVSFASTFEGFGMPIVEGNLVGRVVVTGNTSSMPEVAGGSACLVDPFDVDSIREGFVCVIRDAPYRESLIEKGYENAKRFDPTTITRQYESLYREAAARAATKRPTLLSTLARALPRR